MLLDGISFFLNFVNKSCICWVHQIKLIIPAVILSGRPQYSEDLMFQKTWAVPGLCCAAYTAQPSGPHCTAHTLWLQDKLTVAEEVGGRLHLVPVIRLSACPCLYLKVQQEVLIWILFLFDWRNYDQGCFLVRRSYNTFNNQNGVCTACCTCITARSMLHSLGFQRSKGTYYSLDYTPFLYSVSWNKLHFHWYFTEAKYLSYWDQNDQVPPGAAFPLPLNFF